MSREFPDRVNPWKAAEGQRIVSGTMPLTRMKRLQPLLAPTDKVHDGLAEFNARFSQDGQKRVIIKLDVSAELPLLCQRSMEAYMEPVRRESQLAVLEDLSEQELIPENYEPVLVSDGQIEILALLEDELILGLPQVPKNPALEVVEFQSGDEDIPQEIDTEERQKPFSDLANMLAASKKD